MAKLRISLKPDLKKLEIFTKRNVTSSLMGSYTSVFRGQGLEFKEYGKYTPHDDAKTIDWKASLRANELLVKKFVEERELSVFFLIDVSSTMFFGSTPKLKNEYAAELASSLCSAVLQADDSVGFALFSDKIIQKSFPVKDNKQFYLLLKCLTNPKNYGGQCNFKNAIEFVMTSLKPNSILIIISDFIGFGKNWERLIKTAAGKFDLMGIMVRDPRDRTLPPVRKMVLVEDPFSQKQLLIEPESIREKYKRYVTKQENRIMHTFEKAGAKFISLSSDKEFQKPIMTFFNRRMKQFV